MACDRGPNTGTCLGASAGRSRRLLRRTFDQPPPPGVLLEVGLWWRRRKDVLPMRRYLVPAFLRRERRAFTRADHTMTAPAMRVAAALALLLIGGCAKTTVTDRQYYEGPRLARPARVIVYDFAASASDLPAGYNLAVAAPSAEQTPDDVSLGRKLGAEVAKDLVVEMYVMTAQGLRRLGSAELNSTGPKGPGEALPLAVAVASGNPIGLIVSSAVKVGGEVSGMSTIEGSAKRTAKEIADQLKAGAQRQGWIY